MKLNSLRVCQEASHRLSLLKGRTGLTPNILCRLGFSMSLNDPTIPNPADYPPDSDRIIDRHVLTGPWDKMFVALIKERCKQDGLPVTDDALAEQFKAHVNRGVLLLYKRVKSLNDLALLMPREIYQQVQNEPAEVLDAA
ncbi:MAG: DNA sulfur modification protein DndE [Anaerolineae bacterium]|nr:DNA sulfur modification protein DndE [Anaerolineae bacterium]